MTPGAAAAHTLVPPPTNLTSARGNKSNPCSGLDLLEGVLTYEPERRINADEGLRHVHFKEIPAPKEHRLSSRTTGVERG